jgi:hypothetical protein
MKEPGHQRRVTVRFAKTLRDIQIQSKTRGGEADAYGEIWKRHCHIQVQSKKRGGLEKVDSIELRERVLRKLDQIREPIHLFA